jgi:hypothetical protein
MKVGPADNAYHMMATAQALKNLQLQLTKNSIERKLVQDRNEAEKLLLSRRREALLLDEMYLERAYTKAKLLKGTDVDLYI